MDKFKNQYMFRFWDSTKKKMYPNWKSLPVFLRWELLNSKRVVPMLGFGKSDDKGKMIYCKDILEEKIGKYIVNRYLILHGFYIDAISKENNEGFYVEEYSFIHTEGFTLRKIPRVREYSIYKVNFKKIDIVGNYYEDRYLLFQENQFDNEKFEKVKKNQKGLERYSRKHPTFKREVGGENAKKIY